MTRTDTTAAAGVDVATPAAVEYRARAEARRATLAALRAREMRISNLRLVVFGVAVLLAALIWRDALAGAWLLLPVAAFIVLVRRHDKVTRAADAAGRAADFYDRGLARLEDRWAGSGEAGERFRDDEHPYATDLDLFGQGSLFQLLSIARTGAGEEALAAWLKSSAEPSELAARHEAVRELTGELDLREALSIAGTDVRAGVHTTELVRWAEGPSQLEPWKQWVALVLTSITIVTGVWAWQGTQLPFFLALIAQGVFQVRQRRQVDVVLHGVQMPARDLAILLDLLKHLEDHTFRAPRLVALRERIVASGTPASAIIRRLQRLVEAHDWEHNMIFLPIAALLTWGNHVAYGIERWRARHGRRIGAWLTAVGEIEALSSLSAYRYEHPGDPFPVIDAGPAGTRAHGLFEGSNLGHPLLPAARLVRNDVSVGGHASLLVVSGSNMSGKSTLLRTVGINAVLAFAGAPVRASALRLSPLAIGGTLRIQDSLQEGRSRFYAEITRIRSIVDLARGARPVLFLLDELFHGTNSHDRLVGATGVLRCLLDLGA
ncbi:MAG TPA: hypothetical protein VFV95_00190, partial [Vicinamibacterales bacterium]|nr:hypothetical protein [Vicinamibacterales bacterium]